MKRVTVHDTAGAVRGMMDGSLNADACIAGEFAAERDGAHVIARDVHDHPSNFTRFFVVVRAGGSAGAAGHTTHAMLGAEPPNRPGALREALTVFADGGIDLTNIVCRPIPAQAWSYRFFFEVLADQRTACAAAQRLAAQGKSRVHGCYLTRAAD